MRASLFLLSCAVIAGCLSQSIAEQPASDAGPVENNAPKGDTKPKAGPVEPISKPAEVHFDLVRDTVRVRENLAGTWYQVDHQRDGSSSSLSVAWLFADGTARAEYWSLDHKEHVALHGTDRGRWELRGDTIVFHFEGQPAAPAGQPPPVPEPKPVPPPASTAPRADDLPPAAAPAPATVPAPAAADESMKPRDDEQRLLQAAPDWFTYEYRNAVDAAPTTPPQPPMIYEGVSVRVGNDFKLPRFVPGYRREGPDIEPPTAVEKLIKRILR